MNRKSRATELFERFVSGNEATLDQFIAEQVSEELFIDYKRVTNNGTNSRLEQPDRENFARAVSGFANSEGGIIIWGVDCRHDPERGDIPTTKHPIQNVKRFLSYLESSLSGCTLPPYDQVRHHLIGRIGSDEGFVVTLISKSMFAPHQCIVGRYTGRYYIRVGSNFEQASHGLLAGMFGKNPTPYIFHVWQGGGGISPASYTPLITALPTSTPYVLGKFILRNEGRTVVKDLYVNYVFSLPGPKCMLYAPCFSGWTQSESMSGWHHLTAPQQYRLPPGGMITVTDFQLFLAPPFNQPLWYEISFGCEGSQVFRIIKTVSSEDIRDGHSAFTGSSRDNEAGNRFAKSVFESAGKTPYEEGFE